MYDADPFAARKAVSERQEKAAKKKEEAGSSKDKGQGGSSPEFANAPEAKMAGSLREIVEDSIKKVCHRLRYTWSLCSQTMYNHRHSSCFLRQQTPRQMYWEMIKNQYYSRS